MNGVYIISAPIIPTIPTVPDPEFIVTQTHAAPAAPQINVEIKMIVDIIWKIIQGNRNEGLSFWNVVIRSKIVLTSMTRMTITATMIPKIIK